MVFLHNSMLMTPIFMALARWLTFMLFPRKFLNMSMTSPAGCDVIGCNWTLGRPSCSGARPIDAGIDYRLLPWRLVLPLCYLSPPFMVWEFLSAVTWWCAHVCHTVSYCFAMLRQLRSIHYLVSASVFQSLVTELWSFAVWTVVAGWFSSLPHSR